MSNMSIAEFMDVRGRLGELELPDVAELDFCLAMRALVLHLVLPLIKEATTLRKLLEEAAVEVQVLGASSGMPTTIRKSSRLGGAGALPWR